MYQNFIFDFYGTLADIHTNEDSRVLWQRMAWLYQAQGAAYTAKELKSEFRHLEKQETEDMAKDFAEPDILKVFEKLYTQKGVSLSRDAVLSTACTFRILSRAYIRLYKDAMKLLTWLKAHGKKVYLLSNAQAVFTEPEIRLLGIYDLFDGIFMSSEQQCKKPGTAFFKKLLDTYQLDAKESLMIGNDMFDDIVGALDAGLDCAYIHSNLSRACDLDIKPTYSIETLFDITTLF